MDGGADHNLSHVSVQAAALAMGLLLDLEMCVLICTVAGHSWSNHVEGVMCIFNLAMNGTSLARPAMDERNEAIMAKCGGLGDICAAGDASSNFRESLIGSIGIVIDLWYSMYHTRYTISLDGIVLYNVNLIGSSIQTMYLFTLTVEIYTIHTVYEYHVNHN